MQLVYMGREWIVPDDMESEVARQFKLPTFRVRPRLCL